MWHQVEFLLEGNLLPMTISELRVSDWFLIEAAYPTSGSNKLEYAIAYMATEEEGNYFKSVIAYMNFFLLIYALVSGQHVTYKTGAGTNLHKLSSLGKKRFTFGNFEKLEVEFTGKDEVWTKPIFKTKELFLKLLPSRKEIMESHVGLALIYYYVAVQASQRRFDQAIINLMITLEALLIKESTKFRKLISNRIAVLIAKDEKERLLISKRIKELYDLRSGIVHGGGKKPTFKNTKQLFGYTRQAIEKTLSLGTYSKEELIKKLS